MKVLHLLDHSLPIADGYAFRSDAILRGQRALGWETLQLTSPKHPAERARAETVGELTFHRVPPYQGWLAAVPAGDPLGVIAATREHLARIVAAENPDLIHAHSPCLNALAALGLGCPLVYEMRSSWEDAAVSSGTTTEGSLRYRLSRALETFTLRRADAVVTICAGLRADVLARGVAAKRVTVVPNAVSPGEFTLGSADEAATIRRRWNLGDGAVLGFIGTFFAWEGLDLLLEALPAVLRARPDTRLLLVGDGNEAAALRAQAARLGLEQHVIFAGRVPHAEVDAVYAAIDILVYPRPSTRLTDLVTPLKPLEAMALGKLYVASNCGGHREMVRHRETGMLFEAGDAVALARTVLELIGDPDLQQRLRANGPRYIREERTWARVVPRYRTAYERALGHPIPSPAPAGEG
jgi:PEP-CTERM/exosortase A-associated glycosyltransferase